MLCPKCGYITFDKLSDCPKCNKSWESVAENISGTGSTVERQCFLGRVLKEDDTSEPSPKADLVAEVPPSDSGSTEEPNELLDAGTKADEGSLEAALDELPEIDFTDEKSDESKDEAEIDFSIDIDESAPLPPPAAISKEGTGEGTTVDLNDIDLSGLVSEGDDAQEEENEGISLNMEDLNNGEVEVEISGVDDLSDETSPEIDFNLDDDDDDFLDLSLDLESSESVGPKKKDPVIPDLGLSLDLDE